MPASKPYAFHPEAWREMEGADNWYRERSPDASVRFLEAVYDALESIAQGPTRGPKYLHGTRRFLLYRFPFSIVYLDGADLRIVAVVHHKRKPGYWRDRI